MAHADCLALVLLAGDRVSHVGTAAAPAPPAAPSIADNLRTISAAVTADIRTSDNVDVQRSLTSLGPLLKRAFPVSSLDATQEYPALVPELLRYIGRHDEFDKALVEAADSTPQRVCAVVIAQSSGAGKTRLAYAAGSDKRLVIIARIVNRAGFTRSWQAFEALAACWRAVMPLLGDAARAGVTQSAIAAVELLAACHVAYVADVLRHVTSELGISAPPTAATDASAKQLQQAALRCLRNGRGDDAVGQLFEQHLAMMQSDACHDAVGGATVSVPRVDHAAVQTFRTKVDGQLRALLWPMASIMLSWDEAHALIGDMRWFQPTMRTATVGVAATELRDAFYVLASACAMLAEKAKWLHMMCGTWLELQARSGVDEYSPLRGRVVCVHHASRITADDMLGILTEHLVLDAAAQASLVPLLQQLEGRPIHFFDHMLRWMWGALCTTKPADAATLQCIVHDAARYAFKRSAAAVTDVILRMWNTAPTALAAGGSTHDLCSELYFGLMMCGGVVKLSAAFVDEAMRRGVLALPLAHYPIFASAHANLREEPVLAAAVQQLGDVMVARYAAEPDRDPVFARIGAQLTAALKTGPGMLDSSKGTLLETAFAWSVLRAVKLHVAMLGKPPSLAAVLAPLLAPGCDMPERATREYVIASAALPCNHSVSRPTCLHSFCEAGAETLVRTELDVEAGIDVGFVTVDGAFKPLSLVGSQEKAEAKASLADSLRAASPAWQFVNEPQRAAALAGAAIPPSAKRAAFEELATADDTAPLFVGAFRVVLSVTGFQPSSIATCNALNALDDGTAASPIILCTPAEAAFGRIITNTLKESFSKPKLTAHATTLAMWLPQSIRDVTSGRVVTDETAPAAVRAALKN